MKRTVALLAPFAVVLLLSARPADAFQKDGCGSGDCAGCHTLTRDEAAKIFEGMVDNVVAVDQSPVRGLWVVDIERGGNRFPIYLDFSKKYILNGQVFNLSRKENLTESRMAGYFRVDMSAIPLDNAVLIGNPKAKRRIVVFSDPDCHFCKLLHAESKKMVAQDPDTAFYVLLYSQAKNPSTIRKAKAAICDRSGKLMDEAFEGKEIPAPACETSATEDNARLAEKLNVRGTPTLILPDGRVIRGYRTADALKALLEGGAGGAAGTVKK